MLPVFDRGGASLRRADLRDDDTEVAVHGAIQVFRTRGTLVFASDDLRVIGASAACLTREEMRQRLAAEGLFAASRKRPLPRWPRRIGIVTSSESAALQDIAITIARRWPLCEVVVAPCLIQGEKAPTSIVRALDLLGQEHGRSPLDVVIVSRGGGAASDLEPFNQESVARAVYRFPTPVVSAVGHETDNTVIDDIADRRASTPSAAAELVTPDREDVGQHVRAITLRVSAEARRMVHDKEVGVARLAKRLAYQAPDLAIERERRRTDRAMARIDHLAHQRMGAGQRQLELLSSRRRKGSPIHRISAYEQRLTDAHAQWSVCLNNATSLVQHHLTVLSARLEAASPESILARGYVLVSDATNLPITSYANAPLGAQITITWHDGERQVTVTA